MGVGGCVQARLASSGYVAAGAEDFQCLDHDPSVG